MGVLQETRTNHVSKGMVLLVESEDGGRWDTCFVLFYLAFAQDLPQRCRQHTSINLHVNLVLAISKNKRLVPISGTVSKPWS